MSRFRWRRGHTLLQLAAAMAILAILVLAAMPAYRESRIRGYLAEGASVKRCGISHQAATSWGASTPSTYRTPA